MSYFNVRVIVSSFLILPVMTVYSYVIYSESFLNPTEEPYALDRIGWCANQGVTARRLDCSSNQNKVSPVVAKTDYLFISSTVSPGAPVILWTDAQSFGDISSLTSITFSMHNDSPGENVQLILRIADKWFMTERVFNWSAGFRQFSISIHSKTWCALQFTPEMVLGSGSGSGDVLSLPQTGAVTAFGFYIPKQISNIRINQIEISSKSRLP